MYEIENQNFVLSRQYMGFNIFYNVMLQNILDGVEHIL